MASPVLNMICCLVREGNKNKTKNVYSVHSGHPNKHVMLVLGFLFFTGMFLGALFSLIGTGVTLMPKGGTLRTRREAVADKRQRVILSWLTFSDLLGCTGGLAMAVYGFIELADFSKAPQANPETFASALTCVFLTTWMQFFYLATFFWSFFYALDVYLMLRRYEGKFLFWMYFCLAWLAAAVIMGCNLYYIYRNQKALRCGKESTEYYTGFFIASIVVHVMMFVGIPVFYYLSSRMLSPMLKRGGVYTDRERRLKTQIQKRFFRIVVIFVICWTPNITAYLLAFIQLTILHGEWWDSLFQNLILLVLMAVLNPMQAFLNALVYWGPAGCTKVKPDPEFTPHQASESFFIGQRTNNEEETPLLTDSRM